MTSTLIMGASDAIRTSQDPLEPWLVSARAGDREALEFFLEAIDQRVFILAWRLLGDPVMAEDASQEALWKICRNLERYQVGTNLWGWIYRIVLNQVHDLRRSRMARRESAPEAAAGVPSRTTYDPERSEQLRRVVDAMAALTNRERDALVLIDIEGFSSGEAAKILGCLAITARTRAAQARRKVRRELSRFYPELKET
jgi:RNA polymerase sigma-70 factor (ECF subfamily)